MANKKYSTLGILTLILISCGGDPTSKASEEPENGIEEVEWTSKDFHLNSESDFSIRIYVGKKKLRLQIELDEKESLDFQIANLQKLLSQTTQEFDIGLIQELEIVTNRNKELFNDFVQINAIDSCIRANESEGQSWVDMATVSDNAYKSEQLDNIVDLLRPYSLEPMNYHLEKCAYFNEGEANGKSEYSMWCPFLFVELKKAHNNE